MLDGMTLKETINQEIDKFKSMDGKKRWEYFKTYYLTATIIGLVVIVLAAHLIYSVLLGKREVLASGCFVNVDISEAGELFLTDEYVVFCEKTDKTAVANLSSGNTFDFFSENPLDNNSYEMALLTQLSAGEYQYMILDKTGLERFAKLDVYSDLEEMLTDTQKIALEDRIVYQEAQDGKAQAAAAISLIDTEFAQKYQLNPGDVYLVFIDIEQDVAKNQKLVEYIFGVH